MTSSPSTATGRRHGAQSAAAPRGGAARAEPTWWRQRRHLRGLPAELRRRQRRRHRRPRGRPRRGSRYLADLGVDAIWFTPWYRSPLADGGYDVADYRAIDPAFGTLEEAEPLIAEAAALGIRTIVDIVPNHVSDRARVVPGRPRRAARPPRARPVLVPPGQGPRRRRDADRLALDLLGHHLDPHDEPRRHARRVVPPPVRAAPAGPQLGPPGRPRASTRTSSASGSTAASPASASTPRRCWSRTRPCPRIPEQPGPGEHPNTDRDELHDIYRSLARDRRRLSRHPRPHRRAVARRTSSGSRSYLRPDELHTAFNFDFLARPWDAGGAARVDRRDARRPRPRRRAGDLAALQPRRDPAGHPLRPADSSFAFLTKRRGTPSDLDARARRARAAAPPLPPRCPGSLYIYQGEELGLEEVAGPAGAPAPGPDVLPLRAASTPAATAAACRCPWSGDRARRSASAPTAPTAEPWLRQPAAWAATDRRGPARRPGLDAQPLPRRAPDPAPRRPGPRATGLCAGSPAPGRRARLRARRAASCAVTNLVAGRGRAARRR